ncbi:MAG: hypothetical protein MN733_44075 [Nitrososphaera sp.]|nr:hypothetical protein [Nitrososphaera sp.]
MNQYTQVGGQPFTYDTRGNLTSDGILSMTYDTDNRLTQVVKGPDTVAYQYDWANRLVKKTANGKVTRFVYDGSTVLAEANNAGVIQQKYVVGPKIDEILAQKKVGGVA